MARRVKRLPSSRRSAPHSFQRFGNLKDKIKNYFGKGKEKARYYFGRANKTVEKRPFLSFFVGLGILLLVIILGNTIFKTKPETPSTRTEPKNVTVYRVGESPRISVQGEVKENGVVKIVAQAPGIVSAVNVTEGSTVAKGKILVNLSSNYQGGNAATVQKQLAGVAFQNAKETSEIQSELIARQRDLANQQANNSEELRKITEASIEETDSLIKLNSELISPIKTQIQVLQANNGDPQTIAGLQAQQSQLQAGINQLQSALRATRYQANPNSPANALTTLGREIALKQLDLQEKALKFSLQTAGLQIQLAQIQEQTMFPAAPFAGKIERIHVKKGQALNPGEVIATLTGDEGTIVIDAKVPSEIAKKVTVTQNATIFANGESIDLAPYYVSTEATSGQLYSVLFTLDGTYRPLFTDSAFVTISLPVGSPDTGGVIPFIPVDSVFQTQSDAFVYVVEGGRAQSKKVRLGTVTGRFVAVDQGLSESELVILNRTVIAGEAVRVSN